MKFAPTSPAASEGAGKSRNSCRFQGPRSGFAAGTQRGTAQWRSNTLPCAGSGSIPNFMAASASTAGGYRGIAHRRIETFRARCRRPRPRNACAVSIQRHVRARTAHPAPGFERRTRRPQRERRRRRRTPGCCLSRELIKSQIWPDASRDLEWRRLQPVAFRGPSKAETSQAEACATTPVLKSVRNYAFLCIENNLESESSSTWTARIRRDRFDSGGVGDRHGIPFAVRIAHR